MLRPVTEADLPILFEHQRDPESYRMAAFEPRARDAFMAHWQGRVLADPGNIAKVIVDDGQVVGHVVSFTSEGRRVIGYWIGREFWRRGLASAALRELLRDHEPHRPLFAYVATANVGSMRVMQKCGFTVVDRPTIGPDGVEEQIFTLSSRVRAAVEADVSAIAAIYNHYVTDTVVTFEETAISTEELARRIENVRAASLPWLVAELDGRVVGYAYAGKWNTRSGYRFTAEITVYVDHSVPRQGLGTALYAELFFLLKARGVHAVIGGIVLPNEASVKLHENFGLVKVAHFNEVGFKQGRWLDVAYWQRIFE